MKWGSGRADDVPVDRPPTGDVLTDHTAAIGIYHAMAAAETVEAPEAPAAPAALAMPTRPDEAPAPAPVVPEPPAEAEPALPVDEDDESIAAIRQRLAARGLLVKGPAIVVPKEPRPDAPVVFDDVLAEAEGDHHPNAVPEDDWDVASEGGALVSVRCPQCRGTQQTPVDVTRFRCVTCQRAWRWAICQGCDEVAFTMERQESWRCRCGHVNRSWWRTPYAHRDAGFVIARRRDLAARAERAEVRAGMRTRRWKLITFAVAALIALLVFVGFVRAGESTPAAGTAETCRLFGILKSDLASGTLEQREIDARLDRLSEASSVASDDVRTPVADLAAVASPNKVGFLIAQTKLDDACTRHSEGRSD